MAQNEAKRKHERDRIAAAVERTLIDVVLKEDPNFYECNATQPTEVMAAVTIMGLRRRSDADLVVEAVSHSACRHERARIWKAIEKMAADEQACLEETTPAPAFTGPIVGS